MRNLGDLLSIVLDENYDSADTSIPISCHVLAATFYLVVDTDANGVKKAGASEKRTLFEMIKNNQIWTNIQFWERTIS